MENFPKWGTVTGAAIRRLFVASLFISFHLSAALGLLSFFPSHVKWYVCGMVAWNTFNFAIHDPFSRVSKPIKASQKCSISRDEIVLLSVKWEFEKTKQSVPKLFQDKLIVIQNHTYRLANLESYKTQISFW